MDDALAALRVNGLDAQALRTAPAFGELRVTDGRDSEIEGTPIAVDSRREILAAKRAALVERSEIRELADVKALLDAGGDLEAGLRDAPGKDTGFSPLTLAWVLKSYDPRPAARALGWADARAAELLACRDWLIGRLTSAAAPE